MTLPTSGPLSMSAVLSEFGAPAGTPLTAFVRGGAWVDDTAPNAGVPTALPLGLRQLLGASDTPTPPPIDFVNAYVSHVANFPPTAAASAGYTIRASGVVRRIIGGIATDYHTWLSGGVATDYEVFATVTAGALDNGLAGVWLPCSGNPLWDVNVSGDAEDYHFVDLSLQCRHIPSGTIVDTWTVSLEATITG